MRNTKKVIALLCIIGTTSMGMTKKEHATIAFYDQEAEKFMASSTEDNAPSFWTSELEQFKALLPAGRVLDIGAGKGKEASVLINAGYEYVGVEPATGMRTSLEQLFPNHQFIKETVYDWHLSPASFDGFWCSAMLLHVPPQNLDHVLQQIKKVLKPGAIGFISVAAGNGEYFDAETGRYFYLYDAHDFAKTLERQEFYIEQSGVRSQDTRRQWLRKWLTYFVRAN